MISIRNETPEDYGSIRVLTIAAFANSEFGHHGEAELIDLLRATSTKQLSLVAELDGKIVGHIMFTPVFIRTERHELQGMGLAPMSVDPEFQKSGIGSKLVTAGLERLFADGCPFVVVLGHPEYYTRFGFQAASQFDVLHGFDGIPQEVFFIRCNSNDALTQMTGGRAHYLPEFGPQHEGTQQTGE